MNTPSHIPKNPLKFWWFIARKNRLWMILASVCVILGSFADSIIPYWVKRITDSIMVAQDPAVTQKWIIFFGGIFLVNQLFWRGSGFSGMRWITLSIQETYKTLMEYLTGHSESYFRDQFAGSLGNKIRNVSRGVQSLMETYLWGILSLCILLPTSVFLGFQTHILIGWMIILWIGIIIPVNILFVKKKRKYSIEYAQSGSKLSGQIVDIITNMSSVRQYVRRFSELTHIGTYIERYQQSHLKNWSISEWMLLTNDVIQSTIFMGMLVFCAYLWKNNIITAGDVLMMLNIGMIIQHQLMWIGNQINDIMDSYGEIHEGLGIILGTHEIVDSYGTDEYQASGGKIDIQDVSFSYGKKQIFEHLNCEIQSGEKIGLVGESGAGKSTLVQLLLRQYDVQSGKICFDGHDIREITQDSLRKNIAFIPQDPNLFHRTIHDNIAYGREGATQEEVIEAAKKAQAHEFIVELENNYDTMVGERGIKLSGGQRQRIVIARAILKNAPILILDEATSALDSESEQKIQEALKILMKNKTVIAIAHRLSTIKHLDRIIVFKNGNIVEEGPHDTLAHSGGIYQSLWDHQVGGFVGG